MKQATSKSHDFQEFPDGEEVRRRQWLHIIDHRLANEYGRPTWRSSGDPLDELIGTILSQHTSDTNTARAFAALKARFPDWQAVMHAPTTAVSETIASGGLANIKAPRIQHVLRLIAVEFGSLSLKALDTLSLSESREWLMALPGVGPKTASCVILFSLGLPAMPVDTHVHRLTRRLGLLDTGVNADKAHGALEGLIGPDRDVIYALHLNLIRHGRLICKAHHPRCRDCILADHCPSASS